MITLTDSAATKIRSLQEEIADPSKRLRIFIEPGGCSGFEYGMSFDEAKAGDAELEDKGVPFLVDPSSLEYLKGSQVDFDDGLQGKGFSINNPNATSTCGCGKSFS